MLTVGVWMLLSGLENAQAAQVNTSTYATDLAGHPSPDPLTEVKTGTGSPAVTSSIRRDSTKAHAQAWASASLGATGITKSASGNGWLDPGTPTLDAKGETWSSSASGSPYMVNNANPGSTTTFQLRIPAGPTLNLVGTGYNPAQAQAGDFPLPSPQTISRTQIPAGSNTSFFDFTFHLTAIVQQGVTVQQIFDGGFTVAADGTVTPVGDSTSPFLTLNVDAAGSIGAQFVDNFVFPKTATVINNSVFDLTFVETMQMGDGVSTTGGTFPSLGSMTTQVGGGGSFTAVFEMRNPVDPNSVLVAAPEPASLLSAGIGGLLAIAAVYRRRK
jgi:hypothetical protein